MGRLVRALTDYHHPQSLGSRLRAKRIALLLLLIDEAFQKRKSVRILDLGGTRTYWGVVAPEILAARKVTVTVLNLPGKIRERDDARFRFVDGDACNLSEYDDNVFDIVHSNSVIEHVGDQSRMEAFAREVRRLGPAYFVQTPNYWFPIEPHFFCPGFQWLPETWRAGLLVRTGLGQYARAASMEDALSAVRGIRLLTRRSMAALFPDARIATERFALLPKSLMAIRSER